MVFGGTKCIQFTYSYKVTRRRTWEKIGLTFLTLYFRDFGNIRGGGGVNCILRFGAGRVSLLEPGTRLWASRLFAPSVHDYKLACLHAMAAFGFASFACIINSRLLLVGWFLYMVPAYWLVHLATSVSGNSQVIACMLYHLCMVIYQLVLPACLHVGCSFCQLCLPTSRLLISWVLPAMHDHFWLVLPALPACWLAYLVTYACQLAACWLAGFAWYAWPIIGLFCLPCLPVGWLVLPVMPAC